MHVAELHVQPQACCMDCDPSDMSSSIMGHSLTAQVACE